jgi:hypothetical protein
MHSRSWPRSSVQLNRSRRCIRWRPISPRLDASSRMSRRLPATTVRRIQRFAPESSTKRYSPLPSAYRPDSPTFRTRTAVKRLSGCPRARSVEFVNVAQAQPLDDDFPKLETDYKFGRGLAEPHLTTWNAKSCGTKWGGTMAKEDRGFASMDRTKQREIASKGNYLLDRPSLNQ